VRSKRCRTFRLKRLGVFELSALWVNSRLTERGDTRLTLTGGPHATRSSAAPTASTTRIEPSEATVRINVSAAETLPLARAFSEAGTRLPLGCAQSRLEVRFVLVGERCLQNHPARS